MENIGGTSSEAVPGTLAERDTASANVSKTAVRSITYVCTSNVCRSPMAEYVARKMMIEDVFHNLVPAFSGSLEICSRGLTDYYSAWGSPANKSACDVLAEEKYSIDMSGHKSQPLTDDHMEKTDVVFVMTTEHLAWVKDSLSEKVYERNKHKLRTSGPDIPDPYFYTREAYEDVADMIVQQVETSLVAFLRGEKGTIEKDAESDTRRSEYYEKWKWR